MRSFAVILSFRSTSVVRSVWLGTCAIWKPMGSIMRAISSEVACTYGIGSHLYFLFAGFRRCFCPVICI